MMSSVAERIGAKIKDLTKEKDELQKQIDKMSQKIKNDKKSMHHTELKIVSEEALDHPSVRLIGELREFSKEKSGLDRDESILNDLAMKHKALVKTIENHKFWMRRADTTNLARQREAEKKIFG